MWYIFSSIGNSYSCHPFSVCVVSYSDNCYDWIYFHDSCHRLWTVRNCYKWYIILFFSKDYILLNYFWRARSFFKHIKTRIPPRCREKRVKLKKKKFWFRHKSFWPRYRYFRLIPLTDTEIPLTDFGLSLFPMDLRNSYSYTDLAHLKS